MFSFFTTKSPSGPSTSKGGKRAARNAELRALYSDPLPIPEPPPPFNIFSPAIYKSILFTPETPKPYQGKWCEQTRSVNIANDVEAAEIWRRGMWGKGTLSRSQPSWRARKTKEMRGGSSKLSLEEITARKRRERAEFKEARLRSERMERERLLREEGRLPIQPEKENEETQDMDNVDGPTAETTAITADEKATETVAGTPKTKRRKVDHGEHDETEWPVYTEDYLDKEILQIAPEEALFLMQLDLLTVTHDNKTLSLRDFLHLIATSRPDDPCLIRYIVYYHFRRQRLIVKSGLKFGVDYLLYDRPIPFTHASQCVNILASYHQWTPNHKLVRDEISWQEVNLWQRLMGNVRKKLKLVYVEIPPPEGDWRKIDTRSDFERALGRYRIREVTNSRFAVSRERDVKSK